jgi:hypothetical protein
MNLRTVHLLAVTCAVVASLLCLSSHTVAADNAHPQPIELPGIENPFRVTGRILAGSQPKFDVSFEALAKAGVKTIISVDGSRPDSERATDALRTTLRNYPFDNPRFDRALKQTTQSCTACHKVYRNEK